VTNSVSWAVTGCVSADYLPCYVG